ncbi:MAG: c-type cytochrome [Planctomycetota bacterium]|nr:c-type cytochrome [Planctomycetota bacterium]MDA1105145.1 c-type cytochrome [Planctomycetota bacterium]
MKCAARMAASVASVGVLLAFLAGCDEHGAPLGVPVYRGVDRASAPTPLELFNTNCAGCHGTDGHGSGARALADARWWASVTDAEVLQVSTNGCGVLMPAFAVSAGGMVPDQQMVDAVPAWRSMWGEGGSAAPQGWKVQLGSAVRGEILFASQCASCHAVGGEGGITDPMYIALMSDQALWNGIVFGRPEFGKNGMSTTARDAADIVAWLVSRRPAWATAGGMNQ